MTSAAGLSNAGKVFFGSLCATTFGLGCWQTQRLLEKQAIMDQRSQQLALDPQPYHGQKLDNYRPYRLQGSYRYHQEFLVGPRGPPPGALPDKPGTSARGMSAAPQGYYVITPFVDGSNVLLVNRGWIPRHYVVAERLRGQPRGQRSVAFSSSPPQLAWDRPKEPVDVTVVPAQGESPRFLVAEHELDQDPPRLYWFDLVTMKQLANVPETTPLVTALKDETETDTDDNETITWPVAPPLASVGEVKISPAIHAGYAFTWFGLSAAGMVMTRKLLSKGRK